jgi:hypothetical protein
MRTRPCLARVAARFAVVFLPATILAQAPAPATTTAAPSSPASDASAKIWVDHRDEIESYMKTAEIVSMEDLKIGVTRPRRAAFAPGGPVRYMAFKDIPPGRPAGYWESYKSEIAAYELDKLLGLNMVPPTVEKRVKGTLGAAVMWCSPTKSFAQLGGMPSAPPHYFVSWNRQIARAKMFDNLIGNKDPNLGNWLVDPVWNLILIDHTRAFTTERDMIHKNLEHIDGALWDKMKSLTVENLTQAIGAWVGKGEIKAIIARRDKMRQLIDGLIAQTGEANVVFREP